MVIRLNQLIAAGWVFALTVLCGSLQGQVTRPYASDNVTVKEIGRDLYSLLKPELRTELSPGPIWFINDPRPYTRPYRFETESSPTRIVYISEGFVRLANNVAHAKAIDRGEPGFFKQYMKALSREVIRPNQILPTLITFSETRYWTDQILNEQASYFNQIVGVCSAIELAHHYLGHYDRYADRLRDSAMDPTTMAGVCSIDQWEEALRVGSKHALECGLGFEGLKAFYDCIDYLPRRPGWTIYFLPIRIDVARIKRELDRTENAFFGHR